MSQLKISLFGNPTCQRNGRSLPIQRRKGTAMLAYLAVTEQPHSRESLATMLWPEQDQTGALKNLRRDLARLKKDLGDDAIVADRKTIRLESTANSWVDVVQFESLLAKVQQHRHFPEQPCRDCLTALTEAVSLYTADFMAGFNLPDCPAFDEWHYFQAESLRQSLAAGLQKLIQWHSEQGEHEQAIEYGRRWLALDTLHEPAQRELMRLYAWSGQQAAALRQYQICVRLLDEELGVEPEAETIALYEAIQARQIVAPVEKEAPAEPVTPIRHHLPSQPTPFVGRTHELADIRQILQADPPHRLVTLLGPGGIGKTRLALAVTISEMEAYAHGVHFVPLAPLKSADHIASTIAESVGLRFFGADAPKQQLLDFLHTRQMLLLMDNFEHVLDGTTLVAQILQRAPGVQLLVTSRERLNLNGEVVYAIGGLSFPTGKTAVDIVITEANEYGAIQLLMQHGRRARPQLTVGAEELHHIVRICRIVQGMPLAIVLAAGWLEMLSFQEIADELTQNLDILESRMRDVPERQRSVRAAFDVSWQRLSAVEQDVFMKLSIFRGGFTRRAAQRVSSAGLRTLRTLVHKSFVTMDENRRYQIHELLRQYAEEQLVAAGAAEEARTAHSDYYLEFLHQLEADLKGRRQLDALREIEADFENVRAAWLWALACKNNNVIDRSLESLHLFCDMMARYAEGIGLFETAVTQITPLAEDHSEMTWARLLMRVRFMQVFVPNADQQRILADMKQSLTIAQKYGELAEIAYARFALGGFNIYSGQDVAGALALFTQSLNYYDKIGDQFYKVRGLNYVGMCHAMQADPEGFFKFAHQSMELARSVGTVTDIAIALANLTEVSFSLGDIEAGERYGNEAVAFAGQIGLTIVVAQVKTLLAFKYFLQGELVQCSNLVHEGLKLAEENQYRLTIAYASGLLGILADLKEDYVRAKQLGEKSLAIPLNNTMGIVIAHWALAIAHGHDKEFDLAWRAVLAAFAQADSMGSLAVTSWLMPIAGYLLAGEGRKERAVALMALADVYPLQVSDWLEAWPLFLKLQSNLKSELGDDAYKHAWEQGETLDLAQVVEELREEYEPETEI